MDKLMGSWIEPQKMLFNLWQHVPSPGPPGHAWSGSLHGACTASSCSRTPTPCLSACTVPPPCPSTTHALTPVRHAIGEREATEGGQMRICPAPQPCPTTTCALIPIRHTKNGKRSNRRRCLHAVHTLFNAMGVSATVHHTKRERRSNRRR